MVKLDLGAIGGSALTDTNIDVPEHETPGIPVTYVPARNTVFLSIALGWAEVLGANDIFLGVNAVDYSGYPDCRPEYIKPLNPWLTWQPRPVSRAINCLFMRRYLDMTKGEIVQAGFA